NGGGSGALENESHLVAPGAFSPRSITTNRGVRGSRASVEEIRRLLSAVEEPIWFRYAHGRDTHRVTRSQTAAQTEPASAPLARPSPLWGISWQVLQEELGHRPEEALDFPSSARNLDLRKDQLHTQICRHLFHVLTGKIGAVIGVEGTGNATDMPAGIGFAP